MTSCARNSFLVLMATYGFLLHDSTSMHASVGRQAPLVLLFWEESIFKLLSSLLLSVRD